MQLRLLGIGLTLFVTGCGAVDSAGFLSDHNVCNADLATYSDAAPAEETARAVSAQGLDGSSTFGQRLTNFEKATDLYGLAVRMQTLKALTADVELEIWAKLDKELTYGQTVSTVTPDGEQGVILAKAFVTPAMLPVGEQTWVQAPLEEIASVFASGRYWLMFKPAAGDAPTVSVSAGTGLATYDAASLAWAVSTGERVNHQVIPCQ